MLKKYWIFMVIIFATVATFVWDWAQWDLILMMKIRYNHLIAAMFLYFNVIARILAFIALIILSVFQIRKKHNISIIPLIFVIFAVFMQYVVPFTKANLYFSHKINKTNREKVIQMISNELMETQQIGEGEYKLPIRFRLTSYNAEVIVEDADVSLKGMFYVHKGIKTSALIYSEEKVKDGDFSCEFNKIEQLDDKWYAVEIK